MKFILKKNGEEVLQKDLDRDKEYLIGRQSECDIVLDQEEGISRQHLKFYASPESKGWIVEVLSQYGGLLLNGEEEVDQIEIQNSASFLLKDYTLQFISEESSKEKPEEEQEEKQEENASQTHTNIENTDGGTRVFEDSEIVYSLNVSMDNDATEFVDLTNGESWIIGRDNECDISIEHRHLTRKHFQIIKIGNQFQIKDLGSANGTILNNKAISSKTFQPLKSEDVISISDLKMVFEARRKGFSKIIQNLPALTEDSEEPGPSGHFPVPKVILEDTPILDTEENSYFNKKRITLFSLVGIFLIGLLVSSFLSDKKNTNSDKKKEKLVDETNLAIKNHYTMANRYLGQKNYQFCIDELEKLHIKTSYYKDSQQLLAQCQNALHLTRQNEEIERQKEEANKTANAVTEIVEGCQQRLPEFKSLEDLNICLNQAILKDPSNALISNLQQELQNKESLERISEEEKENLKKYRKQILSSYYRAKAISKNGDALVTIAAYKKFLNKTKNNKAFKKTYNIALKEMTAIQTKYNNVLASLYRDCENLVNSGEMKKAYPKCQNILKFKTQDAKALQWIKQAKDSLKLKMRDLYREANLQESLGNVTEAKELWKKILEQDVEIGYYYKKAKIKLDKYL